MTSQQTSRLPAVSAIRRPPRSVVWLVAGALLVTVLLGGLVMLEAPGPTWVVTEAPTYRDLETSVFSTGRVTPQNQFLARANFGGQIQGIDVHLGQVVTAGQVLVRMKDPYAATRVASARAALQTTEVIDENIRNGGSQEDRIGLQTDLKRAQMEETAATDALATMRGLQQGGAASGAEVHGAAQRLQTAEEVLRAIQQRVQRRYSPRDVASWTAKIAEAHSSLASAQASLANTIIRSPIAGTVYLIPVTSNDFVGTGAELVRVADLQKLEVHANFDEPDIGKLHKGEPVTIRWEGKPDRIWHGTIAHPPLAAVRSGIRSVGECVITINDVTDDLPPDTTVTATVTTERKQHVLSLPREALQTEGKASVVYRVVRGELVRTPVKIGLVNLDRFEVTQGVDVGDRIALHTLDHRELSDGLQVRSRQ